MIGSPGRTAVRFSAIAGEMSFIKTLFSGREADGDQTRVILNRVLKTMRESVIVVGDDTRIIASNEAAYEAFGRRNGPLEGKRLSEVIRDLGLHAAFRAAIEDDRISDVVLETGAIEKRRFEARIAPFEVAGKSGAILIFYETTMIDRLESIRQEFLSNISHELRTPLTSILAFVETLEDGAIEDEENNVRFLAVIRRNAERMHHLIDDILELSSIESGRISIEPKRLNLAKEVSDVFVNLSNKADARGVSLVNEVAAGVTVFADPVRIEQMLTNLIDNAIKFNSEKGTVTVSHRREDGRDVISVADEGEGISADHLQRIFERFYRTDRARSREIGGTGLGLAIVKHLARLHGGEATVTSSPGKGSVFSVELPAKA